MLLDLIRHAASLGGGGDNQMLERQLSWLVGGMLAVAIHWLSVGGQGMNVLCPGGRGNDLLQQGGKLGGTLTGTVFCDGCIVDRYFQGFL